MENLCNLCGFEKEGEKHYEEPLNKEVFWCSECIKGVKKDGYEFKPNKCKEVKKWKKQK